MTSPIWIHQAQRLKPFDGQLIPVKKSGHRIEGSVRNHNFTVEDVLAEPDLRAIELRTSLELMAVDLDSLEAIDYFETKSGLILEDCKSWVVQRDNQDSRMKLIYQRTLEQQKLGEFYINDSKNELEVFSISTKAITVLGHHRESGIYRWYGTGPEKLIYCPPKIWNFVVQIKQELERKKATKAKKSSSKNWRPVRPCPICGRNSDNDCSIHRDRTFIQCHHGKSFHPPTLKLGETIRIDEVDWAFCGFGTNAIGEFSKFKIHISTPDPWDIIYGDRK